MNLHLGQEVARVTDQDLLGEGGEARVYRWRDLALKVFHPAPKKDAAAARALALKLEKLPHFPAGLPGAVVAPAQLVHDAKGQVVGYAMPRLDGVEEASRLLVRRWREGAVPNGALLALFGRLQATLEGLHARGVVVGDLNDGNVLFRGQEPFLIDADSMQYGRWPCAVAHERYLDPRLYGVDLAAGPAFSAETDWYAAAVMLFHALLYVHPFGGVHAKLPTALRRAEARHSVLRPDVAFPRGGVHYRVLPDAALDWFLRVFEKDAREPLPGHLLGMRWTKCRCGLEHARATCPDCQALGPASQVQATRHQGRCRARSVFKTSGRLLAAALQGGVRYVYEEEGVVRREDGQEVLPRTPPPGTRFALQGPWTWVAEPSGRVLGVHQGAVRARAQTDVRGSTPLLAASSSACYRVESGWVVEQVTGARVGQTLSSQSWLWAGERLGFGFYRAGDVRVLFTFEPHRAGLRQVAAADAARVNLKGRVLDCDVVFDADHALLSVRTERGGAEHGGLYLFDAKGRLVALAEGQGGRVFGTARGRALQHGRVLCATDEGLLLLVPEGGALVERSLFADAAPFVAPGDDLLPQPDGSLFVVGQKEVLQLSLC